MEIRLQYLIFGPSSTKNTVHRIQKHSSYKKGEVKRFRYNGNDKISDNMCPTIEKTVVIAIKSDILLEFMTKNVEKKVIDIDA